MNGLDTNVLVRFLVRDDPAQSAQASKWIRSNCTVDSPGFINRIVLCELEWVLESAYRYSRETVANVFTRLFRTAEFIIEDTEEAWVALREYRDGKMDFSDALIGQTNRSGGCETTVTFDRQAGRLETFERLKP